MTVSLSTRACGAKFRPVESRLEKKLGLQRGRAGTRPTDHRWFHCKSLWFIQARPPSKGAGLVTRSTCIAAGVLFSVLSSQHLFLSSSQVSSLRSPGTAP